MKKIIFLVMVLMLTGCAAAEEKKEGHSSMIVTSDGEVVSAYRDGKDVTDERNALESRRTKRLVDF